MSQDNIDLKSLKGNQENNRHIEKPYCWGFLKSRIILYNNCKFYGCAMLVLLGMFTSYCWLVAGKLKSASMQKVGPFQSKS